MQEMNIAENKLLAEYLVEALLELEMEGIMSSYQADIVAIKLDKVLVDFYALQTRELES